MLFGSALALGVINEPTFAMAVGVISLSMLLTPLLIRFGNALANRFENQPKESQGIYSQAVDTVTEQSVLIGGYGRMGHTIATLFEGSGIPFVAFDTDPKRVAQGQAYGHTVLYGDISDPELLAAAHAEQSSLAVVTINHGSSAMHAVSHLRNIYPQVPIIARARDMEECAQLLQAGATQAFPEALESGLHLGVEALQMVGVPAGNVELLLQGVRDKGYELVREKPESGTRD